MLQMISDPSQTSVTNQVRADQSWAACDESELHIIISPRDP